jgi:phosphocarrier protein
VVEREVEIVNRLGLHMRAAAKLVKAANEFTSQITLVKDGEAVDAKSILGLLLFVASQGTRLSVRAEGADEAAALAAVTELIAGRFGEDA